MDISPSELRDSEIREAFRGYNRDEVNDLLERAAGTIDALSMRVRELGERLAQAEAGAVAGRTRDLEEMLERTLLLARQAAEEEVTEAQAKARNLVDEAEKTAHRVVTDAEFDARRINEEERARLEVELVDLAQRRDALDAYVVELERFESEYRTRLVSSIEADLAVIGGRASSLPDDRPEPIEVAVPVIAEGVVTRDDHATQELSLADMELEEVAAADLALDGMAPPPALDMPPVPVPPPDSSPARVASLEEREPDFSSPAPAPMTIDLDGAAEDDAFFAQLREAVSDETPASEGETSFFDQDLDSDRPRDLFRRRR